MSLYWGSYDFGSIFGAPDSWNLPCNEDAGFLYRELLTWFGPSTPCSSTWTIGSTLEERSDRLLDLRN